MTPLRQRMIQDMQLRGFSARTQECYAAAVGQLAAHLANQKKVARPARTKLPAVLSREAVRMPVYPASLTTIYACGLRLSVQPGFCRGLRGAS